MTLVDTLAWSFVKAGEYTVPTEFPVATRSLSHHVREPVTPLVLSCAGVATAATILACFVGLACRDITGAILTLLTAFTLIGLTLLTASNFERRFKSERD